MNNVLFSKKSDDWCTPKKLYNRFISQGFFDPCPFKSSFNGLLIDWKDKNFVNPPYSMIKYFVDKSIEEHKKGNEVILLIPARTDTKYFRKLVDYGSHVIFITGRLHFNSSNSAPFPSCLVILNGNHTFCDWCSRDFYE